MPAFRSRTVNFCPDEPALWQQTSRGAKSECRLMQPGLRPSSPFSLAITGAGEWRSVPRHVEPSRPYLLECDVRGRVRIGLAWVREGSPLGTSRGHEGESPVWRTPDDGPRFAQLTEIGTVRSQELPTDEWQRVTIGGTSPIAANRVQAVLEGLGEETLFDAPYLDGLGAVPTEIAVAAGYHPRSSKIVVVATREAASGGRFEVLCDDAIVLSGQLQRWGEYLWGREYWQADMSQVQEPGRYWLRVVFEGEAEATSQEFTVDPEFYLSLPNMTVGWYHTQRCGVEVPGWHPPCHLDDALIGRSRNRPLGPGGQWTITGKAGLTGGWHDAGDNHKYICWAYLALWALARLHGTQRNDRRELGEALPDALAEAAWEARFILKTMSEDGLFPLGVVSRFGWLSTPIHEETDNLPDTGDERALPHPEERICDIPTYGPVFTSALIASSLADLGMALREQDDDLSRRCLEAARTTWQRHRHGEPPAAEYLRWHAAFALLDASLYRTEPDEAVRSDLEERIARVVAQQKPEGIFPFPRDCNNYQELVLGVPREKRATLPYLSPEKARYAISHEACGIDYIPAPFTYLHALLDYLELFPEGPQAKAARRALGLAMDLAQSLCARTPYGQMMEWTFAPDPVNFVHMFHGYNCALLSLATAAARAARVLPRPDLLVLAEHQVQWVLGRNPRLVSLMCGIGAKQLGLYHTGLARYPEHRTGEQPGGVVNGFVSMNAGRIGYYGPPYPWDFPYMDIRSPSPEADWSGVEADWWTNETWVPNCSWLILAAVAVHRALTSADS